MPSFEEIEVRGAFVRQITSGARTDVGQDGEENFYWDSSNTYIRGQRYSIEDAAWHAFDPTEHLTTLYAPIAADYLVGTANAALTGEIAVGATPGGELGNTWASPTVDATHSGSAHHDAPLTDSLSADFDKDNDTFETALSVSVVTGNVYEVRGHLEITCGATDDAKIQFDAPFASTLNISLVANDDFAVLAFVQGDASPQTIAGALTNEHCELFGSLVANDTGTFALQFAKNADASGETASIIDNSYLKLVKVT